MGYSRFAVVASLKVSKLAVVRNRLQRQTREIVKSLFSQLTGHYDIVINISSKAVNKEYSDLEKDLISIFQKNKLI